MTANPKVFSTRVQTRWLIELVFCVAAYFILLNIFAGSANAEMIDHIYTSIFLGTLIIAGTVNAWVIRKRFLRPGKFLVFVLLSMLNILFWTLINQLLFDKLIDYILPGYYFISYYAYGDLFRFFFVYVTLITLIDLSWEWFQLQETRHRLVIVEKEKINAELKALTNQVNPHFLFNSLTVIYSLSLKNSAQASEAIIRLSDILRYVIYDSARGEVALQDEAALIETYIGLQRYRIDPSTRVEFRTDIRDGKMPVVPMLFLPLVENSFKHGIKGDIANTFVSIDLQSDDHVVTFRIRNNKSDGPPVEKSVGGIGLKNIADRLKLMYPDRHTLSIKDTGHQFSVELTLTTS